jgi:molybdopterin converting factor small subunit
VKVNVRLMALPALIKAMGGKKVEVDFPGETVAELLEHVVKRYGRAAQEALLDDEGQLDAIIQILINERQWVVHDELDVPLNEGDSVIFMLLVAGGEMASSSGTRCKPGRQLSPQPLGRATHTLS